MLWLLAFHIIAVVCWFAGLFYLPRLFVYHAMTQEKSVSEQFKVMEHKLYYYIMWPSMIVTFITGFWLVDDFLALPHSAIWWLHIKIILTFVLAGYQGLCGYYLRQFKKNSNTRSHRFYRWFNEIPSILLIVIVVLAVVKPF